MKKISKNNIRKSFVEKAVVLAIVTVFIGSAFVPAVGSQSKNLQDVASSEMINIGIEESLDSPVLSGSTDSSKDGGSSFLNMFDRMVLGVVKLVNIVVNTVVSGICDVFINEDTSNDRANVDSSTNQMEDDQLTIEDQEKDHSVNNPDNPSPLDVGDPWWNTDWSYRKEITINHTKVDDNLTNFPILISTTLTTDKVQSDGDDILFTSSDGDKLNHEIEYFMYGDGILVWVNTTSISSSEDTVIHMYYGNPTCSSQENIEGVWDSHYLMIQHLNETSGTHYDSTVNNNDGTPYGSLNQDAAGKVDGADDFDGVNDHVNCGSDASLDITDEITIEAWVKTNTVTPAYHYQGIVYKRRIPSPEECNYGFLLADDEVSMGFYNSGWHAHTTTTGNLQVDEWYHLVGTFNEVTDELKIYINGILELNESETSTMVTNGQPVIIGYARCANYYFNGIIDEVRISNMVRDSGWINTSHNNQVDPSGFYSIGSEEATEAPVVSSPSPSDGATNVAISLSNLSFNLSDANGDLMNYTVTTSPDIGSGGGNNVGNDTYNVSVGNLAYDTTYTWYVNVTDGVHWTNRTFSFTTKPNLPPVVSNPSPGDGAVEVPVSLSKLGFNLSDADGDLMNYTVTTSPDIGSGSGNNVGNGAYCVSISGPSYSGVYTWFVNVTDGTVWVNTTFTFTTETPILFDPFQQGWQYQKQIAIDHTKVSTNITNFPVLINITDPDLRDKAQSDGDDILFMNNTGLASKLDHEIEYYNNSDGHLVAWVNILYLSSTNDTILHMYYGHPSAVNQQNPADVWNTHHTVVQHLDEASGLHVDSTSYSNDGVPYGDFEQDAYGMVDGADRFNASGYIEMADSPSLDVANAVTVETWVNSLPSAWSTRREITINNTGNNDTLTDHQIFMNISYDSEMQPDFDDLRFVDSNGNILDYWIKNHSTSNYAHIWVKVPIIPANSTISIWMYYGNPDAESASDITFEFFDDFSYIGYVYVENPWSPVLQKSATGWDSATVNIPRVIYDNGTYSMYYLGSSGSQWHTSQIGVAMSTDGVNFTRHPDNPIIPRVNNTWEHSVMTPTVCKVNDTFYLIYMAADPNHIMTFGLATSSDGIHFTKYPGNPVFDGGPGIENKVEAPMLCYFNGTFHLYYGHYPFVYPRHIFHATSIDCKNWTPDPHNPIVQAGDGGSWTEKCIICPAVVKQGEEYVMFLAASEPPVSISSLKFGTLRSPNPNFYPKSSVIWNVNNPLYHPPWGIDAPHPTVVVSDNNTILYQDNWDVYYTDCTNNYLADAVPGHVINQYKWINRNGSWNTTDSQILQNYGVSNDESLLISSCNVSDYISVKVKAQPRDDDDFLNASIVLRYNNNTCYMVMFRGGMYNDTRVFFYNGSWSQIGSTVSTLNYNDSTEKYDILEASINGYNITGWLNGDQVIQVTDPAHLCSDGNIGLGSWESTNMQVNFDDMQIRRYAPSEPQITFGNEMMVTGSVAGIVDKGDAYALTLVNGTLNGLINQNNVSTFLGAGWHHVTLTYDKDDGVDNQRLYIDGVLMNQRTLSEEIQMNSNNLKISSDVIPFNGTIDEVRISNIARSDGWIATCYNNQNDTSTFYSVGSEEVTEAPVVSSPSPSNGATDVAISLSDLSFTLTDPQGDLMNYSVATVPGIGSGSGNNVGNDTYNVSVGNLAYNTTYTWYVNVTDGVHWTSRTFSFTTKPDLPPVVSNPSPGDGAVEVPVSLSELSFNLSDANGHLMNYTVTTSPDIGSGAGNNVGNDTYNVSVSNLAYNTAYTWYVNVTDGTVWVNETFSFTTTTAFDPFEEEWMYRKMITINHTRVVGESSLHNFPVVINITDPDLRDKAQSDGDDILFMNGSGMAHRLNHEIECYNNGNGHLVAWVNVTNLSSTTNTTLYMYYGNSDCSSQENVSGMWDSDYMMVQHLNETSDPHEDSTCYGNDGTESGGVNQDAVGKVDGADDFDGVNDYVEVSDSDSLTPGTQVTFETWAQIDNIVDYSHFINKWSVDVEDEYLVGTGTDNKVVFGWHTTGGDTWDSPAYNAVSSDGTITVDGSTWNHIVVVRNGTTITFYINGASAGTSNPADNNPFRNSYNSVRIGGQERGSVSRCMDGRIDEVRISNVARSAGWVNTSYNNQVHPDGFYSVGSEEVTEAPVVSSLSPSDGATNVAISLSNLSFNLSDANGDLMNYTVTTSPDIDSGGGNNVGNDTYDVSVSNLAYNTTYTWYVNVTDGVHWTNRTYCFTTIAEPGLWWNTGWSYRKQIIIDHTMVQGDSPLVYFPVLINITDGDLKNDAQDSGDDVVFTDDNGNKLNHEIELFNGSTGELVCWVNVTNLSDTQDTTLYMYYGNPSCSSQENVSGVWDPNHVMVQHLEETSGTHYDSTSCNNDGTPHGGVTQDATGKINGADNFDGVDDYVDCGNDESLNINDAITIGTWIKPSSLPAAYGTVVSKSTNKDYDFGITPGGEIRLHSGDGTQEYGTSSGAGITAGNWYHIVAVRTVTPNNEVKFYANGVYLNTESLSRTPTGSTDSVSIGARSDSSYPFNGIIDEVRISNTARSAGWINTCYNTQHTPSTFYSVGSEETAPTDTVAPDISDVTVTPSDPIDTSPAFGWENITCTVTDNVEVAEVWLNVTYPDMHMENVSMTDIGGGVYYYNTTYADVGSYSYRIWANDTSDNVNISSTNSFEIPPNYDIYVDGKIDIMDIQLVAGVFGNSYAAGSIREDVDNSGLIDIMDIQIVAYYFGETW